MVTVALEELADDNIDDLIGVCSSLDPENDELKRGIKVRREWLLDMLSMYGSVAKIAYIEGKPVAQIMFYPRGRIRPSGRRATTRSTCIASTTRARRISEWGWAGP